MAKASGGLTLWLTGYDRKPDYPRECLDFMAAASIGEFQGCTKFSVYKRDLDAFLDKLDAMVDSFSGEAHLRCGVGETVYFEMKAFYYNRRGHIAVELEVADSGPRDVPRRLLIDFRTEPTLLEKFTTDLRGVTHGKGDAYARLASLAG